ncbi:hypothetical protein [Rouxiella sp. WC2420]|uniref:Uncharacterized protein n=1 Tax=Rouxiella sp. WC2420 TaxID=3234145 RepID=A0AB39VME7_9GAMM
MTALIVSKITEAKTVGLADAVTASIAALFPDATVATADASASSTDVAVVGEDADDSSVAVVV